MNARELRHELPARLVIRDGAGRFLRRVSRREAWDLLGRGGAVIRRGKRGRVRGIQLVPEDRNEYKSSGTFRGPRYSHDRETDQNPRGVWTLKLLPQRSRAAFAGVAFECGAELGERMAA